MDYTCWSHSELVRELQARDAKLIKWEKEITDALNEGDDYKAIKNLRSVVGEMKEKIAEVNITI